jgi:hypothetical protein
MQRQPTLPRRADDKGYQLSAISYQLSAISYQLSALSYQAFGVSGATNRPLQELRATP